MQKQLYNMTRESSPGSRKFSSPAPTDNMRKSFFGGNSNSPLPGALKRTALNNSRLSLSARSTTHSIAGIRSDYNVVESFGRALPVTVNEALTFTGPVANTVSAKISHNDWAWVVQGRRLLIWQYRDAQNTAKLKSPPRNGYVLRNRVTAGGQCRELTLPHSDIGHKSELVSVFQTEGQQMASCIAISATGAVRYWTSIAHDGNSVDLSILTGQEFMRLLNLPTQNGYLAVTSTCTLVFLRVGLSNGHYKLHHKTIKRETSFLSGFGKRFASMLIGMNSGGDKDQTLVGMACESNADDETIVSVLSDRAIQRWRLSSKGNIEQLIYEDTQLLHKMREMLLLKFWNVRLPNDNVEIDIHFLDYHVVKGISYILVGAVNEAHTPQMYYAIVVASPNTEAMQLDSFTPLKLNKFFITKTEQDCLSVRIIIGTSYMYLYTPKVVYPLTMANGAPTAEMEADKIEFQLHADRILCAAFCCNLPLFFSRSHGLVSITPGDFDSTDLLNMSSCNTPDIFAPISVSGSFSAPDQSIANDSVKNLPMFQLDPDDVYSELNNEVGQLKAAFLYRLRRNNGMVKTIIEDLMESIAETDPNGAPIDAYKLDRVVITIAEDLAEDLPVSDPRWQAAIDNYDGNRHALGSSRSMQIINQLQDKSMALQEFIEFLHFSGVWERLNAIPCGSNVLKPTGYILSDIAEKIIGATALRIMQSKFPKLIEDAIEITVGQWDDLWPQSGLTCQDWFYVKLCKFQHIFEALADMADERIISQERATTSVAQVISDINAIALGIFGQVLKYREQNKSSFKVSSNVYENQPWTAMSDSAGVKDALTRLIDISMRYGAQSVTDPEFKYILYQQILELIDMLLEGRKNYLDSVRDTDKFHVLQQQFEVQRHELISALVKDRQYDQAARLAEKYLDFESLVVICDETNDKERLDKYTGKFEENNFSQFAINWHLRQDRRGEIFERFKGNQQALAQFMRDHPSLGWIQLMFNGNFDRAAKVLLELAQCESELVARKKSMLSLSKLAALAVPDSDMKSHVEKVNMELSIIEYQLHLGHDVLQKFGYDAMDQKVFKPEELINLYISEENDAATAEEFRKALNLLNFVDQPYEVQHKIWSAAILRDNWLDYDPNNALDYLQKLLFFKIIEMAPVMHREYDHCLPPIEDFLDSSELGILPQEEQFQYLLKLTYEFVADMFKH